jgi:hypothetical protein
LLEQLRSLSVDGVLPPWSTWFGKEVMRELVPDDALRSLLAQEMPSLPLDFLEQSIPSPIGWDRLPCAYLLLSDAYREAAAEAKGEAGASKRSAALSTCTSSSSPTRSQTLSSGWRAPDTRSTARARARRDGDQHRRLRRAALPDVRHLHRRLLDAHDRDPRV